MQEEILHKVTEFDRVFTPNDFNADGALLVKKGKKAYHLIKIAE